MTGRAAWRRGRWQLLGVLTVWALSGCVGSGKVARTSSIEPLPEGLRIVTDVTAPCREGEAGFDYRFVVIAGTGDLSQKGPLLSALRERNFYHSIGLPDDLPWVRVGYQHREHALRAEIGHLGRYLDDPARFQGPDPASLPAEVRAQPEGHVLIALRPTDFTCASPL
jgi:hypothetical protein